MIQADHYTVKITVYKFYLQVQSSQVAFQWPALKYEKIAKDHQELKKAFTMTDRHKTKRKKQHKG